MMLHLLETAPTHGVPLLDELLIHDDRTTEPRVPWITDLSRLNIMGVVLSTCITKAGRISDWSRTRRTADRSSRQAPERSSRVLKSVVSIIDTSVARPTRHVHFLSCESGNEGT